MHPFSDQSGIAFFDQYSTVVSSIVVTEETLFEWLDKPLNCNDEQRKALSELSTQGFIELLETQNNGV